MNHVAHPHYIANKLVAQRCLLFHMYLRPNQLQSVLLRSGEYSLLWIARQSLNVLQSYYTPNQARPNLKVLVNARVDRVQTEKGANGNLVATGVEFTHGDKTHTVKAKKEVLLSAG